MDIVLYLANILLKDLPIFIDLFNLGTVHHDFGPLWGGGERKEHNAGSIGLE